MSFSQNGRGRYGYVPPAQYGQPIQNPTHSLQRQPSFDSGDDASFFETATTRQSLARPQDELFMDDTQKYQGPPRPSHGSPALSGFQQQYQPHPSAGSPPAQPYNPQQFARTQSQYQASNASYTAQYSPHMGFTHQPYNPAMYSPAPLQRQQSLQSVPSYNTTPLLQASAPTSPGYWPQHSTLPPPQRPIYQPTQSTAYMPSSSPQPTIAPSYSPPNSSTIHPVNGGVYSYPNVAQTPANLYQPSVYDPIPGAPSVSPNPLPMPPYPSQSPPPRHPTHRPLPNAPLEYDTESEWEEHRDAYNDEKQAQEQIYKDIEAAVGTGSSQLRDGRNQLVSERNGDLDSEVSHLQRFDSRGSTLNATGISRFSSSASAVNSQGTLYPYDDDESDAEAAAGLEAMRIAEEQDARRASGGHGLYDSITNTAKPLEESSDSDYANIDMGLYGGGYDAQMSYGNDPTSRNNEMEDQSRPLPNANEFHRSGGHVSVPGLGGMTDYSLPGESSLHPFPDFDTSGRTHGPMGTTAAVQPHRLSFDDGDEQGSLSSRFTESRLSGGSGSESPTKDDIQEMFYHPGMSLSVQRPLPAVPPTYGNRAPQSPTVSNYRKSQHQPYSYTNIDTSRQYYTFNGPEAYTPSDMLSPFGQYVPRSASLSSHSNTPQVIPPVRSRTDAEERQARQRQLRQQGSSGASLDGFDMSTTQPSIHLDLPSLPLGRRRKVSPASLKSIDFKKCKEPWALSNLAEWLKEMCGGENGEGESDLRAKTITECLVALFTHKVSTMNTADAETLSERAVKSMFEASVLLPEEEWVKFGQGTLSGVLWQLTGSGCYAPKLHEHEIHGRCYSHLCHRTLRKINLNAKLLEPSRKSEDWNTFFKITKEQTEAADKKEVQRQYNLHEIVMSEDKYMDRLNVLRVLYRDELQSWQPPIIGSKLPRFIAKVFGKVEHIKKTNEEYLLRELKFRQQEQGPWIIGFSDIFREWIRKARQVYLEYAAGFPEASHMVRKEAERNLLFRQFLDQARDNRLSDRLDWNTYLYAPLKRLQQYTLLLREVYKHSYVENDEKANLSIAIDEINNVTLECDVKIDEMSKKVEMIELNDNLHLRPGMEGVKLHLDHLGRRLIFKGDLQRAGNNRFNWLETHAILFDHYFVLAKTVPQRDAGAGKNKERYDVSKLPIPMILLILESANDDPVVKSTVKGLGTVTTITRPAPSNDQRPNRTNNAERPNALEHVNSNLSISTATSNRTTGATNAEGDTKSMYPFRIKHLGKPEVYTLYAPTAANRQDWCDKIIEAKEQHAASLFAQNEEPFRLRVLADTSFAYDTASAAGRSCGIPIRGTPLDRAIRVMEREYGPIRPAPVCRAMVNCATTFKYSGKDMAAIGTDYGVYISEVSNPRGWTRSIQMNRVTQIEVLEDFSLGLVIADKSLIAYHLDVLAPVSNFPAPVHDSPRRAPQKLSGARDVGFFATARMKDRTLVFYKKREGLSSTFKVLEPVFQKSTEKKPKIFSRSRLSGGGGSTEFFREFDEFYIPTECFGINLFHTYIAVSTPRGFELLTLDKKATMSIPDLKEPSIATIAVRLAGQKPLGMFRKSESEFLLCYEECGVYVDKHGEVSRSVVLEFIGKAKSAAMYGAYLILFDNDFVEVRNAENGRLRQVIAGKDVRCIDYGVPGAGQSGQRTIKIAIAHPENPAGQLVLELELNEGQRE